MNVWTKTFHIVFGSIGRFVLEHIGEVRLMCRAYFSASFAVTVAPDLRKLYTTIEPTVVITFVCVWVIALCVYLNWRIDYHLLYLIHLSTTTNRPVTCICRIMKAFSGIPAGHSRAPPPRSSSFQDSSRLGGTSVTSLSL